MPTRAEIVGAIRAGDLPDLVLLDVIMPGMDGLDTLRAPKEMAPSVPVNMLSARNQASTVIEAVRLGALDYLVEPDDPRGWPKSPSGWRSRTRWRGSSR